jgi:hypothetical protein
MNFLSFQYFLEFELTDTTFPTDPKPNPRH